MNKQHAAVWLDHQEARVFHIDRATFDKVEVLSEHPHQLHRKTGPGATSGRKAQEDEDYYHGIATALAGTKEILIVGPGSAKLALVKHLTRHDAALAENIVGVETVDHPSDRQMVAFARQYFHVLEGRA